MMDKIYMDYAATTPLDETVFQAMVPWLRNEYGNPSSPYAAARKARAAVDEARVDVAEAIGAAPSEVYFTSGGTEALNLAIKGIAYARSDHDDQNGARSPGAALAGVRTAGVGPARERTAREGPTHEHERPLPDRPTGERPTRERPARERTAREGSTHERPLRERPLRERPARRRHLVVSAVEHQAVLESVAFLERNDFTVTRVPVDSEGVVDPRAVDDAIGPDTVLVAVMHANNEIGTIQPIEAVSRVTRERGVPLLVDAVQTVGVLPVNVDDLGCDLLALSAHKFYGPKGVGALYVRRGTKVESLLHGGGQERGLRAGTENVAGIVGLAHALRLARADMEETATELTRLRDALIAGIRDRVPDAILNGHPTNRLPNNVNFCFPGVDGESLLLNLDLAGIAASSGSACTSGSLEASHVLTAIGLPRELAASGLRLTVGKQNTMEQVSAVVEAVANTIERLRGRARTAAAFFPGKE